MSEFIFGTATFAPRYGISNSKITLSVEDSLELIDSALDLGIMHFDTAPTYGNAENIIGYAVKSGRKLVVSSKVSKEACENPTSLSKSVLSSLDKLRVPSLEILYLHDETALLVNDSRYLLSELEKLRKRGLFKKLGVSIYSREVLEILKSNFNQIDVFQVPENICDRRFRESDFLHEMMNDRHEYVVRSVFLQGLLLMKEEEIPPQFGEAKIAIKKLNAFAKRNQISTLDICLAYVRDLSWCDSVIVSAASPRQLTNIMTSKVDLPDSWELEVPRITNDLIDPRTWVL